MSLDHLSILEFCQRTGLSKTTAHKLIKQGDIAAIKIGSRTLIASESVQALIKRSVIKTA